MIAFAPGCIVDDETVTLHYAKTPETHQSMDRTFTLAGTPDDPIERFIFAGFYRPSQHFAGLEVSGASGECVASISRLTAPTSLPSLLTIALGENWEEDSLFYRLF